MLDTLPADIIFHVWKFLGDTDHLLRLCAASTHIQYSLRKPYRKLVRYRLLLYDPRCLDHHLCMQWLRSCDFETLDDVSSAFTKKRHIAQDSYKILLALIECGPTNVFAVEIGDLGTLLFSTQHAAMPSELFRFHIKCVCYSKDPQKLLLAPLVAVIDSYGGFYPTKHLDTLPKLVFNGLMCSPLIALMARYRITKKCNVCWHTTQRIPCHQQNPGLCNQCFNKYKHKMQTNPTSYIFLTE